MLPRRSEKLALIHLARKDTALDDIAYRALLMGAAGVDSSAKIIAEAQFNEIMLAFENLGFKRRLRGKRLPLRDEQIGNLATRRQLYYIKGLWELASRKQDEKSLRAMTKRIGHVDDLRFLTKKAASALILALRDMCWKVGIDPDSPARSEGAKEAL